MGASMSSVDGMDTPVDAGTGGQQPLLPASPDRMAESARYAVLGRLAPMLRHDVAGALQPLGMIAALLQKRLRAAAPEIEAIAKSADTLHALTKEAAATCLGVMGWLTPKEEESVCAQAGAQELLTLMETELFLHGLVGVNDIPAGEARFARLFFRGVFAAALLALCDHSAGAGSVHVGLLNLPGAAGVCLRVAPDALTPPAQPVQRHRRIGWDDVRALAAAAGVAFTQGENWLALQLPVDSAAGV
jgi:hypothetical protein